MHGGMASGRNLARHRRLGISARVFSIALALQMPLAMTSAGPSKAAVAYSCTATNIKHAIVERYNTTRRYQAVIGDARVRSLVPCLNPSTSLYGYPFVLPANMDHASDGTGRIVQLGYMECRLGGPSRLGGVPCDNVPHFVYTPDDYVGGTVALADGWAGTPVVGHRYRFKIEKAVASSWSYCIRDISASTAYRCTSTARTWESDARRAWWGTETNNTANALGPKCCDDVSMYWMQYRFGDSSSWLVTEDNVVAEKNPPHPARYHSFAYDAVDTNGDGLTNDSDGLLSHTHDQ